MQLENNPTTSTLKKNLEEVKAFTFVSLAFFWVSSQPHLGHTAGLCLFLYM